MAQPYYTVLEVVTSKYSTVVKFDKLFTSRQDAVARMRQIYKTVLENKKILSTVKITKITENIDDEEWLARLHYTEGTGEVSYKITVERLETAENAANTKSATPSYSGTTKYGPRMWRLMSTTREDLIPFVKALHKCMPIKEYKAASKSLIFVIFANNDKPFEDNQNFFDYIKTQPTLRNNKMIGPDFIGFDSLWTQDGNGDKDFKRTYLVEITSGDWVSPDNTNEKVNTTYSDKENM